jgi:hypothetical protein
MCGATFWNGTHEVIFKLDGKRRWCIWHHVEEQSRTINEWSCFMPPLWGCPLLQERFPPSRGIWNFLQKLRAPRET